jgi:quinoprotein glucose dehydrogenase
MTVRSILIGGAVVLGTAVLVAQQGTGGGQWPRHWGDAGATKYSPLDQINSSNVSQLRIAWRRPGVDASITAKAPDVAYASNFRPTPLMIDGVLYSPNAIGLVEAFHPGTGKTIWVQEPFADEGAQAYRGDSSRGAAYWTDGKERRLFVIRGEYLIALDARTGQPLAQFGQSGRVNLRTGLGQRAGRYSWSGVPQICRDVLIVGVGIGGSMNDRPTQREGVPGLVQAFDIRTGKPRWTFNPIPRPGEVGNQTW